MRPAGTAVDFLFEEPGDDTHGIELDGKTIAEVPLTLTMKGSGDPFNPVKMGFVDGPWSKLAYITLPKKSNADELPRFAFWDRAGVLELDADLGLDGYLGMGRVYQSRAAGPKRVSGEIGGALQYRARQESEHFGAWLRTAVPEDPPGQRKSTQTEAPASVHS